LIEIIGDSATSEYSAAEEIRDALCNLWPGLDSSPREEEEVKIRASAKISGYKVSDIDVVLCARLRPDRKFIPKGLLKDLGGNKVVKKPISVANLVVAIEVKDHSEDSVRTAGDSVSVRYSRGGPLKWKNATDQNIDQVHSLKDYCHDQGRDFFVHRCLVMRGLGDLRIAGAVPSGFDGRTFLTRVAQVSKVRKSAAGYELSSGASSEVAGLLREPIFERVIPTSLDRKRMDEIIASYAETEEIHHFFGQKMLRIRGRGGTGKTVMLLQAAWAQFQESGRRSIVLTYNHALAADISRIMALLGVSSSPEGGGITVRTVMSFMYTWLNRMQVIEKEQPDSIDSYPEYCKQALELIRGGAVSVEDINAIKENDPDAFDFDAILVDEGQDWPQPEADLLKSLYRPEMICVADGVDQLLRGRATDWERGVDSHEVKPLDRCLRLKRNLAVFANGVAAAAGVNWKVKPNNQAGGGRVILLTGAYSQNTDLHAELLESAHAGGNDEIDFLFCVPPQDIRSTGDRRQSQLGQHMVEAGYDIWDGTDHRLRKDFPRRSTQYRIVQYASCRGLEGWTVVLDCLDLQWDFLKSTAPGELHSGGGGDVPSFVDPSEQSRKLAWQQLMIPLTRPMDTLVISLADPASECGELLLSLANEMPEIVSVL